MSTNTAAELSLINDAEFLETLEHWDPRSAAPAAEASELREAFADAFEPRETFADAFDLLEQGLGVRPNAVPVPEPARVDHERESLREEPGIPYAAAAIVIALCLTAGAAGAAAFFHDRLAQITAPMSASR